MGRKIKIVKKVSQDENLFEKLETQNKALQKIIKRLKTGNDGPNSDSKHNNK